MRRFGEGLLKRHIPPDLARGCHDHRDLSTMLSDGFLKSRTLSSCELHRIAHGETRLQDGDDVTIIGKLEAVQEAANMLW